MSQKCDEGEQQPKRQKIVCELGECCYHKKDSHFDMFTHPHLDNLLMEIENGPISIPSTYKPKISNKTLIQQLRMLRNFSQNEIAKPRLPVKNVIQEKIAERQANVGICPFKEKCYRKNPQHFQYYRHPHLEQLLAEYGDDTPSSLKMSISSETLKEQLYFVKKFHFQCIEKKANPEGKTLESSNASAGPSSVNEDSPNKRKISKEAHARNLEMENKARVVILDRVKQNILDKMKLAAPYNVFFTTISDSPATHTEMSSLCFPELLDPNLGDLESSLQINFLIQFGWVLAQYQIMGHRGKPMTLLYGEIDIKSLNTFSKFLTAVEVKTPPFGSHHTKMMVFSYKDNSVRVVVSTANLVESDWDNRTQGLWVSPKCPLLKDGSGPMSGESPTNFKRDLLRYLSHYNLSELAPWISKISQCDMSSISVFFVASVPGSHTVNKHLWGQNCLSRILKENIEIVENNSYPVIIQCSSIGSLGPNPNSWLMGEMLRTFSSGKAAGLMSQPPLKFVYPSFNNIVNSHDGILGGGCLPYGKKTHDKQPWVTKFMYQWISEKRHRTRAPPHIKTYCRVSPDLSKMSYFLLTSANLSKAAWGLQTKAGSLSISSYEAGVLFLPQFVCGKNHFPLTNAAQEDNIPLFSLPYDLPLTPFEATDEPWIMDHLL